MDGWLYTRGVPDRNLAGLSLRWALLPYPPSPWVLAAAQHLGRDVRHVDMYGFQREIIAATEPTAGRPLAYVESQAREKYPGGVEVYFYLIIRETDGAVRGTELESYNPFFGCEVGYLEWCQDCIILIYREKHRTYVCRVDPKNRTAFVAIGDDWVVEAEVISHRFALDPTVRRLALPNLNDLPPMTNRECTEQ